MSTTTSLPLPDYFLGENQTEIFDLDGEFRTYRDRYLLLQAQHNLLEAISSGAEPGSSEEVEKQLKEKRALLDKALGAL